MERTLLFTSVDWDNWYRGKVSAWGSDRLVQSWADTDEPKEYPCILIESENMDECGYGFTCYDFIYKSEVEKLFS